jgi:hypothetical protein
MNPLSELTKTLFEVTEGIDSLNEVDKKKRGTLGKLTLASGQMIGNSLGTKAGIYIAASYAISKEVYALITAHQVYSIPLIILETLAIIGASSLTGRRLGHYVTNRTLNFVESLSDRR